MGKNIYTGIFVGSTLFLGYSATRIVKSIRRFNNSIKFIDFVDIRKNINHTIDSINSRNV